MAVVLAVEQHISNARLQAVVEAIASELANHPGLEADSLRTVSLRVEFYEVTGWPTTTLFRTESQRDL